MGWSKQGSKLEVWDDKDKDMVLQSWLREITWSGLVMGRRSIMIVKITYRSEAKGSKVRGRQLTTMEGKVRQFIAKRA